MGMILNPFRYAISGGFDPVSDLTWEHLWYVEGSAFGGLSYSNGAALSGGWPDEIGSLDLSSGSQTYQSSVASLGGNPAIDFAGTAGLTASSTSVSQPFSLVIIMRFDTDPPGIRYVVDEISSGGSRVFFLTLSSPDDYVFGAATGVQGGAPAGLDLDPVGFRIYFDNASSALYENGSSVLTGTAGSGSFTDIRLGESRGSSNQLDGKIALVGIASGDISAQGGWSDFQSWANTKYGATIF